MQASASVFERCGTLRLAQRLAGETISVRGLLQMFQVLQDDYQHANIIGIWTASRLSNEPLKMSTWKA